MTSPIPPDIGSWYETIHGEQLEVVASDPDDDSIEVQYFDGAVEELDQEQWDETILAAIEPPEDYSGSLDMDREDYGRDYDSAGRGLWGNPLDRFE